MLFNQVYDRQVRLRAFQFLSEQCQIHRDGILPRRLLEAGFLFENRRIPLVSPQGIFRPAGALYPLTITTTPGGPYADTFREGGTLEYSYRGTNPAHRDNVGLREAMRDQIPLAYLFGLKPGLYLPAWPVFIVGDDQSSLKFSVQVDDERRVEATSELQPMIVAEARREYVTSIVQRRLHQQSFRLRVLDAYRATCAVCRLKHHELLEAAHILPDGHPMGEPVVPNGVALCTLHHAAFDANILGIRPDLRIILRSDILEEIDGPMLLHGLQGFHETQIKVPASPALKPNPAFLEERFEMFLRAG